MPVTKTAKRALRVSDRKKDLNTLIFTNLDKAIRAAKKSRTKESVQKVYALADRAVKKEIMHKNKASRIKSAISKLAKPATSAKKTVKTVKKTSKKSSK